VGVARYNVISFRQSDAENARLMEIASQKGCTVTDVLREALSLWEMQHKLLTQGGGEVE
jgi:hypothetical protein